MKLTYNAISHCGIVRHNNEDAILVGSIILRDDADTFCFEMPENGIVFPALVCDGVGGNAHGEVASMMACECFKTFFDSLEPGLDDNQLIRCLKQVFSETNGKILQAGDTRGMASTLTGVLVYGGKAFVVNAGDSRTYRFRYDNLKQLTNENTVVRGNRRIITNCLGMPDATLDVGISAIIDDDIFIICSDGLFDMIDDSAIASNAASADALLHQALSAGGHDNTSLIVIHFQDTPDSHLAQPTR